MRSHKDLDVWKAATELAAAVYSVTRRFPEDERCGLTSQMRRAAISVASNIAEGAARQTDKEFTHFLYTAAGSASELDTQVEICLMVLDRQEEELNAIQQETGRISKMLQGLIRSVRSKA